MKISIRFAIVLLCACGGALSSTSLYSHYAATATQYCDLNRMFNCDVVNRSPYSALLGVPVALIGLAGYLVLAGLSVSRRRGAEVARAAAALLGLGFALYLTYIEDVVLATWCLLCIGSLASIAGIAVLAGIQAARPRPGAAERS